MENEPRVGIDYFTNVDKGDETESGGEIMYRLKQQDLQRQEEYRQASLGGEFDQIPTVPGAKSIDQQIDESA